MIIATTLIALVLLAGFQKDMHGDNNHYPGVKK
jgi:hypothetical protein